MEISFNKYVFKYNEVTKNMFSQKYKEDTIKELFESIDQLDRIELQNTFIQQNQHRNLLKTIQSTFMIISFISLSFLIYFSTAFSHLLSLGLFSELHRQAGLFFIFTFLVSGVLFVTVFIQRLLQSEKFKKENDEQLDFILNK